MSEQITILAERRDGNDAGPALWRTEFERIHRMAAAGMRRRAGPRRLAIETAADRPALAAA
jgi:hypothetical protein